MKRAGQTAQGILWLLSVLASRMYLGVFFGLAVWAVLPMVIHWQSTVVISGSMEPGVSTGDIVVAQTYTPEEIRNGVVKVGNVTLAKSPDKPDTLVTHRVIEILPNGDFVTKGDANRTPDSTPVPQENVIGIERLAIPYIGLPLQTLREGNPVPMMAFALLTVIAQYIVVRDFQNDRAWARKLKAAKKKHESEAAASMKGMTNGAKVATAAAGIVTVTALIAALVPASTPTGFSHAAFSHSVPNTKSSFSAAADWTPPTAAMQQPVSPLKGVVSVLATATDDKSGIRSTTIQYQSAGAATWITLCTVTVSPYSCSWNTATVTDGNYDLRAVAVDNAGFTDTSAPVRTTVANNMLVVLTSPGDNVRGTVALKTSLYNTGLIIYSVRVEYAVAGSNNWKSICTELLSPYTCSWNTTSFANGEYDLRSVASFGLTTFTSQTIYGVVVDNLAPTVVMTDPTTPISGNWTFSATASDTHSGVTAVTIQYAPNGSATYSDLCTFTATPYSCRVDTLALPNGTYTFRAIADDAAGNRSISALITNRIIDNTVSSVSMEDPGEFIKGTATLTAIANSTAGVGSVVIQMAPTGTTTWTTVCTFALTPYTCRWNSTTVPNGSYDFRARLTDSKGIVTTSATVAARRVDNVPLNAVDVQPASGTGTVGKIDAGDVIAYTYNEQVNLATVTSGWTGAAIPVTVRLQDGSIVGQGSSTDRLDIQRSGAAVNLGTVNLRQNYIKNNKTATYNATIVASTVTVAGKTATRITVTLGSLATGNLNTLLTVTTAASMIWTPSTAVLDLNGMPSSAAPVTETGTADRDF